MGGYVGVLLGKTLGGDMDECLCSGEQGRKCEQLYFFGRLSQKGVTLEEAVNSLVGKRIEKLICVNDL